MLHNLQEWNKKTHRQFVCAFLYARVWKSGDCILTKGR